jgi:hypothetical protein
LALAAAEEALLPLLLLLPSESLSEPLELELDSDSRSRFLPPLVLVCCLALAAGASDMALGVRKGASDRAPTCPPCTLTTSQPRTIIDQHTHERMRDINTNTVCDRMGLPCIEVVKSRPIFLGAARSALDKGL